jgi:putative transposase
VKSRIVLEGLPGDLKRALQQYVDYYNYKRYHESLNNLTPADVLTVVARK